MVQVTEQMESPVVSVVIPTIGRASVLDAVESVLAQTYPHLEALVVYDGEGELGIDMPADKRVTVASTGGRGDPAAARALGIQMARGRYLALLDDDDTWASEKLALQLAMMEQQNADRVNVICASRVRLVDEQGRGRLVVPTRLIRPDESVAEYLFVRRRVRWGEAVIHPSSLMCDRQLASQTPWASVHPHEDWDWLLRLASEGRVKVMMSEEPLVNVTETAGSASRSIKWRESLAWVTRTQALTRRQRADILLCTTAAFARAAGDKRAVALIAKRALVDGKAGLPAWVFFVTFQLLPPPALTRLARALPVALLPRRT